MLSRLRLPQASRSTRLGSARARPRSSARPFVRGTEGPRRPTPSPPALESRGRVCARGTPARAPQRRRGALLRGGRRERVVSLLCLLLPGFEADPAATSSAATTRGAGRGPPLGTRGDGDGNAVGDEGLDETSDVFRDRVLVSGEQMGLSDSLDSVTTAKNRLGERPRGPARRTPAPARAPTMIAASELHSPASPAKARRSPRRGAARGKRRGRGDRGHRGRLRAPRL